MYQPLRGDVLLCVRCVLRGPKHPKVDTYSSMVNAHAQAGDAGAKDWFQKMVDARLRPDEQTYNSMVNAHAQGYVNEP